jgi:hypothetical protein
MESRQTKQHALTWKRKRVDPLAGYTDERQTAEDLGVGLRTLRKWRQQGKGPPYVKFARQIHYPIEFLEAWLKRHVVQPIRT